MFNRYHELKHVVIVGDGDYIEREWDTLATLPKVYFLYECEYDCEYKWYYEQFDLTDLCPAWNPNEQSGPEGKRFKVKVESDHAQALVLIKVITFKY